MNEHHFMVRFESKIFKAVSMFSQPKVGASKRVAESAEDSEKNPGCNQDINLLI
jgi:hypothetical protein